MKCLWMMWAALLLLCWAPLGFAEAATPVPGPSVGKVTAKRLNVRAKPGTRYEIVCQLQQGDEVQVIKVAEDWLGISPPAAAAAWIPQQAIDDKQKTLKTVPVMSGPGPVFSSYFTLAKGKQVKVLRVRDDKWAQIVPPSAALVWVSKNYVQLADAVTETKPEPIPPEPEKVDAESPVAAPPPPPNVKIHRIAPKAGPKEITFISDAKPVSKKGFVLQLGTEGSPWAYALALYVDDTYFPVAYLAGDAEVLKGLELKKVAIEGKQRWVQGWPRPLIAIDKVTAVEEKAGN